jgi:hypothetical protein
MLRPACSGMTPLVGDTKAQTLSVPSVTIGMSVFNNAPYVKTAVASILSQSFSDFEFLIVDDGSSDGSSSVLAELANRDARIRLLRQANRGLIEALNWIIADARAPLIARMDGDDIAHRERLERQLYFLRSHPEVGVLGTNVEDIDAWGRPIGARTCYPSDHAILVRDLGCSSPFCHSSVMMRTGLVRAAGGYRPAFRHCEDYDLWLRLSERTRFSNLPEQLLRYRRSPQQVSNRHALPQRLGSTIAWRAHQERKAGRPDPTEGLTTLPAVAELDALFGSGAGDDVRATVTLGIVYSPTALRGDGLQLILDHIRSGGVRTGLWRTVGRLLKLCEPRRAAMLAASLIACAFGAGDAVGHGSADQLQFTRTSLLSGDTGQGESQ